MKAYGKSWESNTDKRIRKELEKSIQSVTLKLRAVSQKRTRLYEDFADGILSDEEYAYAKTSFLELPALPGVFVKNNKKRRKV